MGEGAKKQEPQIVSVDRRSASAENVKAAVDVLIAGGKPEEVAKAPQCNLPPVPPPVLIQAPADRGKAEKPEKPIRETPAQREQREAQDREHRISAAREAGMLILLSRVRMGEDPRKHEMINAILECGSRLAQADRLFVECGRSFEQIAETMGATLGYLKAMEDHRSLRWYRRWFTKRPQFPTFGTHVQDTTKPTHEPGPPVIPDAQAAKVAAEQAVVAATPTASDAVN